MTLFPFHHLPEHAQEAAKYHFLLGRTGPCRTAGIPGGFLIPSPADVDQHAQAWQLFDIAMPEPLYHTERMRQVLANIPHMHCGLRRNSFLRRPAYIFGNGPSAAESRRVIPPKGQRQGIVFALNAAGAIFESDADYWCSWDTLWADGKDSWRSDLIAEWASWDMRSVEGIFSVYACNEVVENFLGAGGQQVHMVNGCARSPYRGFTSNDLPNMIEGTQGLQSVMHLAYWLGCDPIILFGVDQAAEIALPPLSEEDRAEQAIEGVVNAALHAGGKVGWRPENRQWQRCSGIAGDVHTTYQFLLASAHTAAMCMWMVDAGRSVINCSQGLHFIFAPPFPADMVVNKIERMAA